MSDGASQRMLTIDPSKTFAAGGVVLEPDIKGSAKLAIAKNHFAFILIAVEGNQSTPFSCDPREATRGCGVIDRHPALKGTGCLDDLSGCR
jgi:hypothetical protein